MSSGTIELPATDVWVTFGIFALVQLGQLISNLTHQRDLNAQQEEAIAEQKKETTDRFDEIKEKHAQDLLDMKGHVESVRSGLAGQIQSMASNGSEQRRELREEIAGVARDIDALAAEVRRELSGLREARAAVDAVKDRINADIEKLNQRTHELRNSLNSVLRTHEDSRQSAVELTNSIHRLQADLAQIGKKVNGG